MLHDEPGRFVVPPGSAPSCLPRRRRRVQIEFAALKPAVLSTAPCSETCSNITGIIGEMRVEIVAREVARFVHRSNVVSVAHDPVAGLQTELGSLCLAGSRSGRRTFLLLRPAARIRLPTFPSGRR